LVASYRSLLNINPPYTIHSTVWFA